MWARATVLLLAAALAGCIGPSAGPVEPAPFVGVPRSGCLAWPPLSSGLPPLPWSAPGLLGGARGRSLLMALMHSPPSPPLPCPARPPAAPHPRQVVVDGLDAQTARDPLHQHVSNVSDDREGGQHDQASEDEGADGVDDVPAGAGVQWVGGVRRGVGDEAGGRGRGRAELPRLRSEHGGPEGTVALQAW